MKYVTLLLTAGLILLSTLACGSRRDTGETAPRPTPTPDTTPGKVVVTTDKTEYQPGEMVQISVRNNLDVSVVYAKQVECGLSFWELETCGGKKMAYRMPCEWFVPQHGFTELEPGGTLTGEWHGTVEGREGSEPAARMLQDRRALFHRRARVDGYELA